MDLGGSRRNLQLTKRGRRNGRGREGHSVRSPTLFMVVYSLKAVYLKVAEEWDRESGSQERWIGAGVQLLGVH